MCLIKIIAYLTLESAARMTVSDLMSITQKCIILRSPEFGRKDVLLY